MRRGARRCADQQPRLSQRMDTVKETLAKRQAPYAQDVCAHRENTANGPEASGSRAAGSGERAGRPGWASGDPGERGPGSGARPHAECALFQRLRCPKRWKSAHSISATRRFCGTTLFQHVVFAACRSCGTALPQDGASAARLFCSATVLRNGVHWSLVSPPLPHQKSPAPQRGTGLHAYE